MINIFGKKKKNQSIDKVDGMQFETQLVTFQKVTNELDEENHHKVYGFDLNFRKLFKTNRQVDVQLDFSSNEDIDYLIKLLNELKEK